MSQIGRNRLAVLIDADNAQAAICEALLAEISKLGVSTIKRAYGDWTTPNLAPWKEHLLRHAIHPVQQFSYTQGKNATDSALIIDAMDLLYSGNVEGFCLISSDSDFTRLAARLRESGMLVYGFGEDKTPQPFMSACDKFIYSEGLRKVAEMPQENDREKEARVLKTQILTAVKAYKQQDGWTPLTLVGNHIYKSMPQLELRNHGAAKLGILVNKLDYLEVDRRPTKGGIVHFFVRKKSSASSQQKAG
ncbi:NYN domain-containing protein [Cobetia sp. SIMBA_158]|uniref:NYN domain-containing protein n=1 Tax=Cobetia sp. SIMBA_158 TaxID=3081617 RepID=UPI00397F34DD